MQTNGILYIYMMVDFHLNESAWMGHVLKKNHKNDLYKRRGQQAARDTHVWAMQGKDGHRPSNFSGVNNVEPLPSGKIRIKPIQARSKRNPSQSPQISRYLPAIERGNGKKTIDT